MPTSFSICLCEYIRKCLNETLFTNCDYYFRMKMAEIEVDETSREAVMRRTMCRLWTNFAKFGDPTPDHSNPLHPVKWSPVKNVAPDSKTVDIDCLVINEHSKMIRNPNHERIEFWRGIYKKWNENFLNPKL